MGAALLAGKSAVANQGVFCSSTGTTFRAMRSKAEAPSEATDEDTDEARGLGRGGAPAGLVAAEAQVGSASAKPGGGG